MKPFVILVIACLAFSDSRPTDADVTEETTVSTAQPEKEEEHWVPEGRDKNDWLSCHGLPCEEWEEVQRKSTIINILDSVKSSTIAKAADELREGQHDIEGEHDEGPDILLTPRQAEEILQETIAEKLEAVGLQSKKTRVKRKIERNTDYRWELPIRYKFDGSHFQSDRNAIRRAINEWETKTCVRFQEMRTTESYKGAHLIFTNAYGCFSFVGKLNLSPYTPQQINLGAGCLSKPGVPIHEIGHALGLWHEHQRHNRDNFLDIQEHKIASWALGNFHKRKETETIDYNVPYDYNSVMQYSGKVGTTDGNLTIKTRDPLYQKNLGQRVELSFLDAKVVNMAYCQNECSHYPYLYCHNGGYQDPNDCFKCICPDGLTGRWCDETLPSIGGSCSDTIYIEPGKEVILTSPGYESSTFYQEGTSCNWLLKVSSSRYRIVAKFTEQFGLFSISDKCYHWAEIKTKDDLTYPGYRFCGSRLPDATMVSERQKMMLIFRSDIAAHRSAYLRGFKLKVTAVPREQAYDRNYPDITTTTTTTTRPTTTTTRRTTSTTRPTTTTRRPTTTTTTTTRPTTTTTTTTTRPTTTTTTTTRPTTTTTTTTTPKPTTTTTRRTTTTKRTTTTRRPTTTTSRTNRGMIRYGWSSWSPCQGHHCRCGSFSSRYRLRLCNGEICDGNRYQEEVEKCDNVCSSTDVMKIFIGRVYERPCKACKTGYRPNNLSKCVQME